MIRTGLSLAFAIIPEELPILITMVLGLGAYRLSRQNFLVKPRHGWRRWVDLIVDAHTAHRAKAVKE